MRKYRFLIIGAGPTGLSAAYRLKELGETDFLVLEKSTQPGGLSTTYVDRRGFYWDVGGHVLFSRERRFLDLMKQVLPPNFWLEHDRSAFIRLGGQFVPYPLQYNIRHLPDGILKECLHDLEKSHREAKGIVHYANFLEWLRGQFGEALTKAFFLPYNRKVWGYSPERLGTGWVGDRVAASDLERIRKNIEAATDDADWGPNSRFRYPADGGTAAIWRGLAEKVGEYHIQYGKTVSQIDVRNRELILASGERAGFERLLSSAPLTELCEMIKPELDPEVLQLSRNLLYSSCDVVGVGIEGSTPDHLREKSWIYFPEDNCPFYRVTIFSNYSPAHVPASGNSWSLLTETCSSRERQLPKDIVRATLDGLVATGLLSRNAKVSSTWHHRAEFAYPTPSLDRDAILNRVLPALECSAIFSRGRFGAWKYEFGNQDHSCIQGLEWADRMMGAGRELLIGAAAKS